MKLFKYITIAFSSLFMCGCSDYLDNAPDDTLTMEMVFNDRTRTEDWLSGVYNRIPDNYWDLLKVWGYDSMGDDLDPSQRWYQWWGNSLNFIIGQWFTSSTWDAAIWSANPIRIRSAYLFIENAHALPDQGVSEANIERMKDECRFLIAYYYWQMIEAYGSVPFFDGLADVNDPNLMRGQMPFDEMVDWIDAQLVDLSKKLPASYLNESTQFYGRATSIMCLAVRARMLLFAASPLVNGNEWYAGFKNYDGKFRFSQTYDPAKWKRAADANRELIEAAHAAGHDLVREYNADGSIDPFMSCYNVFFLRGDQNPEALFIRSDCNFSEFEKHATPRGASGNGGLGVYQTLVDAFAMKDGSLPITGYDGNYGKPIINKESGYTERGFSAQKDIRKTPWANYGKVDNIGVDLSLTYNQQITKDLHIGFRGTFTYAHNTIVEMDEALGVMGTNRQRTGHSVNELFGLVADGLFTEDDFVTNDKGDLVLKEGIPSHTFNSVRPGDIKYVDIDGDGSITNKDEVAMGGTVNPEIVYGFGATARYKQVDFNVFFQGNGKTHRFIGGVASNFLPGSSQGAMGNVLTNYNDRWTPENPSEDVFYPRLSYGANTNNSQNSTWWLRNMSMLRMKDIEVGYTLPKRWMSRIGLENIRLYAKGSNLLTFSAFDLWDPELDTQNGAKYPIMKSVSFGIDVNF